MATIMTRVDPATNMPRWYEIDLQPTLLANIRSSHWGRIGAAVQSKTFWFDDGSAVDQMAKLVSATKGHRRYSSVSVAFRFFPRHKWLK